LLAVVVLCVTGFWPVAPLLSSASSTPQLPLCCRANGKHKCGLSRLQQEGAGSNAGAALRSVCGDWPISIGASSTAISPSVFLPPAKQLFFAAILNHPAVQAQTESQYRISFERSRHKRGPPLSL